MAFKPHTQWYGDEYYFGLHYDLHANINDTDLGERADPETLVPLLKMMNPSWVQTDCKGHAGYTSWFSEVPDASVSPGTVKDAMAGWRAATKELGLKLHCHYSGVWDSAAGMKHPEWSVLDVDGDRVMGDYDKGWVSQAMCPRSDYDEKLMIPQMFELIDRYGVDGFWVDGEIWAVHACYCDRCTAAFAEATGITEPPRDPSDPNWFTWMQFQRDSFHEHVTRYCDEVHNHKDGVLVCSNWLQTYRHPGEPKVPTDWISGDNTWIWGMDGSRCEARFISTRGKHWDIMLWGFYKIGPMRDQTKPWTFKPVQMLQQEAAVTIALGGSVQIYEHPQGLRNGQLVPWRQKRMGEVGKFVNARRSLSQDSEMLPQVAVLHSEHHYYADATVPFPGPGESTRSVSGGTFAMLENHYGTDILDEWALLPRLQDFAVVVAPERNKMSEEMVNALKDYVQKGGKLIVSGADAYERFGEDFLGLKSTAIEEEKSYDVAVTEGSVPVYSAVWRMVEPTSAQPFSTLGISSLLDERLLDYPAAVINQVGEGAVAYIPYDVFAYFAETHYPMVRQFIGELTRELAGKLPIRVQAPHCVDVVLRRKDGQTVVHLINRASGVANEPNDGAIDEIPFVGPITLQIDQPEAPEQVQLAFEDAGFNWDYVGGTLTATLERLHIHAAIVVR
ncbi:MAG: alpha-L-fucosidase [Anaerolineae bacterium]|nr:alpha-L-fucosidase [Anaerolineae bacterium]